HLPDALADARFTDFRRLRQANARTLLAVPLLREGNPIGVINLLRRKVQPFSQKQIDLVTTFADQAVIAIENARLFEEVRELNRDLTALGELGRAVSSTLDLKVVLKTILYEPQGRKSLDALTRIRSNGKHLLGLINSVLDIAKIESGQFSLNLGEYALESVV